MSGTVAGVQSMRSASLVVPRTAAPDQLTAAAQQFESVLLGQWLRDAESSFGSAPGGDDDAEDSCGDQMKDVGVRQLATQLSADGGIGIGRMVKEALVKTNGTDVSRDAGEAAAHVYREDAAALGSASGVVR
ncbi:MAG TPA: hypothetical protein VGM11_13310 [Acidobacteriaceae bacterium]|jgi:Rod binding domain-containing protein